MNLCGCLLSLNGHFVSLGSLCISVKGFCASSCFFLHMLAAVFCLFMIIWDLSVVVLSPCGHFLSFYVFVFTSLCCCFVCLC